MGEFIGAVAAGMIPLAIICVVGIVWNWRWIIHGGKPPVR